MYILLFSHRFKYDISGFLSLCFTLKLLNYDNDSKISVQNCTRRLFISSEYIKYMRDPLLAVRKFGFKFDSQKFSLSYFVLYTLLPFKIGSNQLIGVIIPFMGSVNKV